MSKLLTNQIANYNDNGPVEAKEGLNFPTNKPLQVAGSSGTNGQYLKSTGNGLAWQTFPSIPAAQVNADWNATTGIAQILNKPTLSTVATSGSYNDLSNKPTIPSVQVNADWNATSGLAQILNKPTLFSGSYSDLTGKPTIPATITDLVDVQLPNPIPNNTYLKWDQAQLRWVPGTGAAGIADVVQDTTPQLGGNLDTNAFDITGGTSSTIELQGQSSKLRFHYDTIGDLPSATTWHGMFAHVHSTGRAYYAHGGDWEPLAKLTDITADTNTTYIMDAVAAAGGNVNIRLISSTSVQDDVTVTAGANITIDNIGTGGFRINSSAGPTNLNGLTDVTISNPLTGQLLQYNGAEWLNTTVSLSGGGASNLDALTDVTLNTPSNGQYLSYNSSSGQWVNTTVPSVNLDALSDVVITSPSTGQVLKYNGTNWVNDTDATGSGGGSVGLSSRTTASGTTTSLSNNQAGNLTITAAKTYALLKVETTAAAWITIYTDTASRTADASRTQNTDPTPGSGVLAEVVTTGAQTILMTPSVYGFNNDATPSSSVYLKVVNQSGSTSTITVNLTYVQLEA